MSVSMLVVKLVEHTSTRVRLLLLSAPHTRKFVSCVCLWVCTCRRKQRGNAQRASEGNLEFLDGMILGGGGDKAGIGDKQLAHMEWTIEPLPDDFDDEDLD